MDAELEQLKYELKRDTEMSLEDKYAEVIDVQLLEIFPAKLCSIKSKEIKEVLCVTKIIVIKKAHQFNIRYVKEDENNYPELNSNQYKLFHIFFAFCNTEVKEACLPYYAFILTEIQQV